MKSLGRSRSVRGDSSPLSAESQTRQREPFCLGPFRQQKGFGPSTPSRSGRSRANGENVPPDNSSNPTAATAAYVKANTPSQDTISPAQPKSSSRRGRNNSGVAPLPGSPALLPRPPYTRPSPTGGKPEQPVVQAQDNTGPTKRKLQWDGGAASASETVPIAATADTSGSDSGVKVIVRLRPLSNKEAQEEAKQAVQKISGDAVALGDQQFTYDAVASERASQREVFEMVGLPMVENCLAGFNSSIFAYGQTGSGKTHTMMGVAVDPDSNAPPSEERGLIPRVFERLFARMQQEEKFHMEKELSYQCRCSFLEIYNEQITDLLEPSQKNLQIREDIKTGVYVDSLSEEFVSNVDDITRLLLQGLTNRRTAATNMNNESSRSHSVFTCVIESRFKNLAEGGNSVRSSRMNLVDLAGSERQKQTGAAGERLKEAGNINKSLSQLGNVINILAEVAQTGKLRHIPYRDSRLTFLLQESLGGNAKLAMICAVSPAVSCRSETLSTLRFAKRAKAIQNKAVVNEETSNDVGLLREQIRQLKDELTRMKTSSNQDAGTGGYSNGWNARRSYNLLRLSLSHPVTLSSADSEDTDLEMEIEDCDREAAVEISPTEKSDREASKDAIVRLPAIDEKGGQDEDYSMDIDESKTSDTVKDCGDSSPKVKASPGPPDLELPHITVRADSEVHSGLELLPSIDDDSVNLGCAESSAPELLKTPEVSRIPELRIPTVSLHSPPLSVSPRLRRSSKKGLSGSPLGPPPLEIPAGGLPSGNPACDEIYHSTQERFCDGTSTSQSLQLQNGSPQQSNVRASTAARPTEKLAACLQRGLQILDNQQRTSLACVRKSTAAALRFSVQGNDIQIPKFVDRLEKGVQTSPIVLVTACTSPLAQTRSNFELPLSIEAPAVEEPTDSFRCDNFYVGSSSCEALPEGAHQQPADTAGANVPPFSSAEDSEKFSPSPPRSRGFVSEPDCRSRDDVSQTAYHTPASITSKSSDFSQWQMVAMDAPICSVVRAGPSPSSKLQLAQAVEALLAGAIRREQCAEDATNKQAAEIEQLNRLVRQYKHERECNSILHQTREDKIARLEALMDNTIPTDAYLNEEWSSLLLEHKLLQDKFDNHPEVTLSHVEQQRLREELDQYRNFFDLGEREILLEEVKHLRNQVVSLLEHSGNSSNRQRRLSVARMSLHTSKFAEAATECPSPSSLALLSAPRGVQKEQSELSMVVAGAAASEVNVSQSGEEERAEAAGSRSVQEWEVEKREMEQDWEDRERDWMAVLEELREEAESYKRQAEKRKQEVECEKRCSEEMQDALQMAMTGHARLLEQYAELQEKHISLLAKHRKIKEGTADVKKMAKKAGVTSVESRWLDSQAVQISALKVENEEERQKSKEEIEGLQAQLRDTAEAVQAAGELLMRLKEAEESVTVAQDDAALAEQNAGSVRRDMEKARRRHATEVATLQQRLLESRLQKTAVCPMCVMAERVKFQFTEVDAETAQATLEAEARAMAIKEEQDWLALQRKKAAENPHSGPAHDYVDETVWTGEYDENVNGYDEYLSEEELHLDEFDDIDHLFTHS